MYRKIHEKRDIYVGSAYSVTKHFSWIDLYVYHSTLCITNNTNTQHNMKFLFISISIPDQRVYNLGFGVENPRTLWKKGW